MEVVDNTINVVFREIHSGTCFVWGLSYYMKIRVIEYDSFTNEGKYNYLALNLETGFAEKINEEEKVRLIKTKLIVD